MSSTDMLSNTATNDIRAITVITDIRTTTAYWQSGNETLISFNWWCSTANLELYVLWDKKEIVG